MLLISNSTNAGEEYLRYPMPEIGRFLQGVSEIVFVPYAAVTFSYAEYEKKVQARFSELGIRVRSVHRAKDPARMVREAEALCVGGGNTFALAKKMQEQGLMAAILRKIKAGTPYVGWSAGSNVACPTICTTNDMPIVEPQSFKAVGAVKFQINPHYLDANPEGHAGETREQRIREAEGEAQALMTVQKALADSIRLLNDAAPTDKVLAIKSLEALQKVADGKATKIIIPSEIQGIAGLVKGLTEVGTDVQKAE